MSMHLYQMSTKLLGDTVGKMNDNLTSIVLAASVITLTLGYVSKMLLKQSSDKDLVSSHENEKMITEMQQLVLIVCCVFYFFQKYPPYIPSSIPFLGHAIAFGKSPIEFLEEAYEKVRSTIDIC